MIAGLPASTPEHSPASVTRTYYLITGLYSLSASLIWGVNTLFLLESGLDILGVFIANAVFTGSMALFEIPTGVLADARGRRTSFLLSVAVVLVGTLGYVAVGKLDGGLVWFCVMSVVLGLGYTFYSGAVEAWLVDALTATGFTGERDHVFARGSMVFGSAMLIGSVGGGLLGTLDLSFAFVGRAVMLAGVYVVAHVGMHDLGFKPRAVSTRELPGEMKQIAKLSVRYGWGERSVRLLIITSAIQAVFIAWGFHAWQPYFLQLLGYDAPWVAGVVAALVGAATIVGNGFVEVATRYCGKRTTLMGGAIAVAAIATLGVGLADSFWVAVGLYLVVMAAVGVYGPVRQAYMHKMVPSEQRATVISFDSLVSSGGSVVGQSGLGYYARVRGLAGGYVVGSVITLAALPVVLWLRRREDQGDVIIGDAGKKSPCAPAGLPKVAHVDATARHS